MAHIDVLRDEMDRVRTKLGTAQQCITELEGEIGLLVDEILKCPSKVSHAQMHQLAALAPKD